MYQKIKPKEIPTIKKSIVKIVNDTLKQYDDKKDELVTFNKSLKNQSPEIHKSQVKPTKHTKELSPSPTKHFDDPNYNDQGKTNKNIIMEQKKNE